jgi:hypothetical protein
MTGFWEVRTNQTDVQPKWGGCLILAWCVTRTEGIALVQATDAELDRVRKAPHVARVRPAIEGSTYVDTRSGESWFIRRGEPLRVGRA